ncbi:MAG: 50S ribosomal protein L25 [Deltaproteobacteria bacterium]|nr:50S ribosomal protein L25 [Deltaproteobacteria bacterium]
MEFAKLTATTRQLTGKGPARRMRRDGRVPAVIYGQKFETMPISVIPKDLTNALSGPLKINTVLSIQIEGGDAKTPKEIHAIVRDHQYHPVQRDLLHVDFLAIDVEKPVNVGIPLVTKGRSLGEQEGGTLTVHYREIPVECRPADIPAFLEIEVSELELNGHVHARDREMPENVTIALAPEISLITVLAPRAEVEEEVPEEGEEGEEGAEGEAGEGEAKPADGAAADDKAAKPGKPEEKKKD